MLLLIPHLFPSLRLLETALQNFRLPALEILLARGTIHATPAEGTEAALCQALGIVRQQDWPVAAMTLASEGRPPGNAYWLRADPVHFRVMRDRLVLTDSRTLNLLPEEADTLAAAIADHFGDALRPMPLDPHRWYIETPHPPRLTTTPLSIATGRDIDRLQPQGDDAQRFRSLSNELQMLLFAHPINQAREARGDLAVNSLWLWGGGTQPRASRAVASLYSNDPDAAAIGQYCGAQLHATPSALQKSLIQTGNVILLDALTPAGQCGDAYGWREAIGAMEQDWFAPLRATLHSLGREGLQLADPVNGKSLHLHPTDAWKIWRRPKKLQGIAA